MFYQTSPPALLLTDKKSCSHLHLWPLFWFSPFAPPITQLKPAAVFNKSAQPPSQRPPPPAATCSFKHWPTAARRITSSRMSRIRRRVPPTLSPAAPWSTAWRERRLATPTPARTTTPPPWNTSGATIPVQTGLWNLQVRQRQLRWRPFTKSGKHRSVVRSSTGSTVYCLLSLKIRQL